MAKTTQGFGLLLILIGIGGYAFLKPHHITAFIPAVFGLLILIAGKLAEKEANRKHAIHGALLVALICLCGTMPGLVTLPKLLSGANVPRPGAVMDQSVTAVLTIIYLVIAIRSFIAARRNPTAV